MLLNADTQMPSKFRRIIFRKKPQKQDSKNTSRIAALENEPPQSTADSKPQSRRSSITIETATTPSVQQTTAVPPATSQSEQCAEGRVAADLPTDSLGLNVLVARDNAVVDILFLHGLTGRRDTTWTAERASEPWPKTLLSKDIVDARIITYGYDANVVHWARPAGQNTVREHARNLINDFTIVRRKTDSIGRPIIFVAHSLGGLVCQDALLVCMNPSEEYQRDILSSTRGVAFLGTPHAGSDFQKFASAVADIISLCQVKEPNKNILKVLNSHSEVLANVKDGFLTMVRTRMC